MHDSEYLQNHLLDIKNILAKHRIVESLVRKQNLVDIQRLFEQLDAEAVASILEASSADDRFILWSLIRAERRESIRLVMSAQPNTDGQTDLKQRTRNMRIRVFDLHEGRLRQIPIDSKDDLARVKPIWIDLVMPEDEHLAWAEDIFGVELPNPRDLTDLESSARFYVEDNGEIHLHSDFLLDRKDESGNVAVAFVLNEDMLFSVRAKELPVFRLQRLRARAQSGYVTDAKDVLLDLYAAEVEYSANALEDVYTELEEVGRQVFKSQMTDEEAANILAAIAAEEDLNGRIRRNVLDTRRALSFLMRGKFLSKIQGEDVREILRDIESLDGHTAFLFNKINFQMDATVGFININQNKDIKRLTIISVIFMPLNLLAGVGGMSEYSMMTQGLPWEASYALFTTGLVIVGWVTFKGLKFFENRTLETRAVKSHKARL